MMAEDFFQESKLFTKESNYKQLKTALNWLLILLAFDGLISLIYLVLSISIGVDYYMKWSRESIQILELVYKILAYLFIITHIVLFTIAAAKNKNTVARTVVISIGVLHIVTFIYYQFVR